MLERILDTFVVQNLVVTVESSGDLVKGKIRKDAELPIFYVHYRGFSIRKIKKITIDSEFKDIVIELF